jgi:hypothetical protein
LEASESVKQKLRTGKSTISKEYKKILIQERRTRLMNEKPIIDLPSGCQLYQGDFMEIGKKYSR